MSASVASPSAARFLKNTRCSPRRIAIVASSCVTCTRSQSSSGALVLASSSAPEEDWLLVHVTQEDATMAILRGEHLVFFRNRAADGEATLADMVHQTTMYYEDRLSGKGFGKVLLAGTGSAVSQGASDADYLRRALE